MAPTAGRRWLVWSIPALIFVVAFFHRPAPGVLAKDLMQAFDATGALVGLLSAAYFYAYAGGMIPAGVLIDTFGVRRVVALGSAVMGVGTLMMGVATAQAMLFTGRVVVGLGATVAFVGALKVAATWFPPAQFGTMAALTATMGVVGSLVSTVPLAWLVTVAGWRGALWTVGLLTLLCSLLCLLIVRDRTDATAPGEPPAHLGTVIQGALQVLANRHTWPPFLAFFFLYAAMGNLMLWVIPYLRDVYGLETTSAAVYATANSLALLVTAPLTGWVSDRVLQRRKLPYSVLTGGQVLLWGVFVATLGRLPLSGLYALLFGMGIVGGAFVLTWPIGREVNPPRLAGVAVAVVNLGGFLGAALTQGPLGMVLDAGWAGTMAGGARVYPVGAYRATFTVCAIFVLLALFLTLCVRETRGRNIHEELRRSAA